MATGTAVAMGVILVDFATTPGVASAQAGLLLVVGSLTAVTARVTTGYLADDVLRRPLLGAAKVAMLGSSSSAPV